MPNDATNKTKHLTTIKETIFLALSLDERACISLTAWHNELVRMTKQNLHHESTKFNVALLFPVWFLGFWFLALRSWLFGIRVGKVKHQL